MKVCLVSNQVKAIKLRLNINKKNVTKYFSHQSKLIENTCCDLKF